MSDNKKDKEETETTTEPKNSKLEVNKETVRNLNSPHSSPDDAKPDATSAAGGGGAGGCGG